MENKETQELININELQQAKQEVMQSASGLSSVLKEQKYMEIALVTAKRFPRDLTATEDGITRLAKRERFAEQAEFSYPRGGQDIRGATIRLMEAIAQLYGNIDFGGNVLYRGDGYSECEAYAWDCENNSKYKRTFTVYHTRDTKKGKVKLTDARDISEVEQNMISRNVRSCLERIIPRYLIDDAIEQCNATLMSDTKSLTDRIADAKQRFFDDFNIDGVFLERLLGLKSSQWTNSHLKKLIEYYNALKSGDVTVEGLQENFTQKLTAKQIKELALEIGNNENKLAKLKTYGFEPTTLSEITLKDYDTILEDIKSVE